MDFLSFSSKVQLWIHSTNQKEDRTNVAPTESPEEARSVPQHALDVVGEPLHAVDPADARRLDEHDEEDGQPGAVDVQQVYQVDPALRPRNEHRH